MTDSDYVTWAELDKHCTTSQATCRKIMMAEAGREAATTDGERRLGMAEIVNSLRDLERKVTTLEQLITSKVGYFLPKPILFMLVAGCIGIGLAGRDAFSVILRIFGVSAQ